MSSNKHVKEEMIKIYGKKCFIEELHLRKPSEIEQDKKRFKGKCQRYIMDQLTYHHILERCRGGRATVENGALLRNINHIWFHRLPREKQRVINELFQQYKRQFPKKVNVEFVDDLDTGIEIDIAEIEPTDKGVKVNKRSKLSWKKKKKKRRGHER